MSERESGSWGIFFNCVVCLLPLVGFRHQRGIEERLPLCRGEPCATIHRAARSAPSNCDHPLQAGQVSRVWSTSPTHNQQNLKDSSSTPKKRMPSEIVVHAVWAVMVGAFYALYTVMSEGAANEQALIHSEDEICSLEALLEDEMRVEAPNNPVVQPSSHAALRNAKRAVAALKERSPYSYYFWSASRRRDLCRKFGILGSHKAYYLAARRTKRVVPTAVDATHVHNDLLKVVCDATYEGVDDAGDAQAALLTPPADLNSLIDLESEIQKWLHPQWWCSTEARRKHLKKKKMELVTALENLDETQRLEWLFQLA
jgi:hypothetical protein